MDPTVNNNKVAQLQEGTGFPAPLQLLLLQFLSLALNHVSLSKEGGKSAQEWKNSFLHVNETKDNLSRLEDMVERSLSKQDLEQSHIERLENKIQLLESKIDNTFMAVIKDRDDKSDLLLSILKLQDFEIVHQFQEQGKKLNAFQDKLKEENDKIYKTMSHFEEELQGLKSNLQEQPNNIKSNVEEEMDNLSSKLMERLNTLESNLQVKLESLQSNLDKKLTTQNESLQFTVFRLEEELKRQEKFVEDKVQTVLKSITNIEKIEFQSQAENSQCQSQMIALSSKYQSVTEELNNSQSLLTVKNEEINRLTEELNNVQAELNVTNSRVHSLTEEVKQSQILLKSTTDEVRSCRLRMNISQELVKMSESQREDKLLEAAETGNVTLTETLLLLGTNVSARDAMLNTPLHLAAYYGHTDVVRLLINGGAEIDTRKSNGYTPLHLAVSSDSAADMVRLLIAHGADLEAEDDDMRTPLLWATGQSNSLPAVQTLISLGANRAVTDRDGRTLQDMAKFWGNKAVANWLSAH
ncbi:putative leucine-rich repeat-containing protein DDB_G0290503 [Periplaneta americana]|uniref:putative leucine-rich repeat-containing protein DDB_G0290503 n=1 Tax=Periplaneta americana TaxID=6978 RepID=UPI0037E80027